MRPYDDSPPKRVFRVASTTIDETGHGLTIDGRSCDIEPILRALLIALLKRAKEVVPKDELITVVWTKGPPANAENSLTNAISRLRKALGDDGARIIELVPETGYRIGLPVEIWTSVKTPRLDLGLMEGSPVPSRPRWRLEQALDEDGRVWRASHRDTGERWVFSFADTIARSTLLRREALTSQVLSGRVGHRNEFGFVVDCEFGVVPNFVARQFVTTSLAAFAASGGLTGLAMDSRIALVAQLARIVARAHACGVMHGGITPHRILMTEGTDGQWRMRLYGFMGVQTEPTPASELREAAPPSAQSYWAPELRATGSLSPAADVYALGVLLFQLARGKLEAGLTADWADTVSDRFVRDDIAIAAADDPAQRFGSADQLAINLETLSDRHIPADLKAQVQRQTARTRKIGGLAVLLGVMLGAAVLFALGLRHARNVAIAERMRAEDTARVTEQTVSGLIDNLAHGLGDNATAQIGVIEQLLTTADATLTRMINLAPGDAALRRLQARGLAEFSRTYIEKGDVTAALEANEKAAGIQRQLLEADASDVALALELVDTERRAGDIKMKQYDRPAALAAYRAEQDILGRLIAANRSDPELQRRMARTEEDVGDVQMAEGDLATALASYRRAEGTIRQFFAAHSGEIDWLLDLATSEAKIGTALEALSDWRGALDAYQADLDIRRQLVERDGSNNAWRHGLTVAESNVGDEQFYLKEFGASLASYEASLALDQELARVDPDNIAWQRAIAVANSDIGDVKEAQGDYAGTVAAYLASEQVIRQLASKSPDDVGLQRDLLACELNSAEAMVKIGDRRAALDASDALALVHKLYAAHPDDPELKHALQQASDIGKSAGIKP